MPAPLPKPPKEVLYQLYEVDRKSYREIMDILNINAARAIKRWLIEYEIPIRTGGEAVKTQWENNDERKHKQAESRRRLSLGNTQRRLSDEVVGEKLNKKGLKLIERKIINGYTVVTVECLTCEYKFSRHAKNINCGGCPKCSSKRRGEQSKTPFETIQNLFIENDMILISSEYINSGFPLEYICINHPLEGIKKRTVSNVKRFGKCVLCNLEQRHKDKKTNDRERLRYMLTGWRKAVFQRDQYTCQCCGNKKGGNLEAHHIKNFNDHEHLRFDIDNGITLCQNCHNPNKKGSFHYVYGTRNNTKEQLEEYINARMKEKTPK